MLETLIQQHFIDPIATVLRDPPKDTDWARDLAQRFEGREFSPEALRAAAESLIRKGGKSFPAFTACVRALESAPRIQAAQAHRSRITKENYHDAARAYGRLVVISRDEPVRWSAWRRYAESLGLHMMAKRLGPDSTQREWTVPSDMPGQFDPSWIDPNPSEATQRGTEGYYGADMRRRQADELMSRLPSKLRPKKQEWGGMDAEDWREAARSEIEGAALSPEALSKLGIHQEAAE